MKNILLKLIICVSIFTNCFVQASDALIGANCLIENVDSENAQTPPPSIKLGVLYIQFADWESNYHARGSVDNVSLGEFYQYSNYEEQIFSGGIYITPDPLGTPILTTIS